MNIMMAAVLAEGVTTIENAAKEPHIVDLANFLNSMGADIKGAGTDSIRIRGVEKLSGGSYCIIPDQIEAGTYMAAVAAAGGQVLIKNVIPKHMDCISAKLMEMGVHIEEQEMCIRDSARAVHRAQHRELPLRPRRAAAHARYDLQQPGHAPLRAPRRRPAARRRPRRRILHARDTLLHALFCPALQ